jgi:hypothetical protein
MQRFLAKPGEVTEGGADVQSWKISSRRDIRYD